MPEGLSKEERAEIKIAKLSSSFTSKPQQN